MPMSSIDKREEDRVQLTTTAEIHTYDGKIFAVETEDISSGGVKLKYVEIERKYLGQSCTLKLIVPTEFGSHVTDLQAKIVRFDSSGIGLQFTGLDINLGGSY
jgi:hypothetical protein